MLHIHRTIGNMYSGEQQFRNTIRLATFFAKFLFIPKATIEYFYILLFQMKIKMIMWRMQKDTEYRFRLIRGVKYNTFKSTKHLTYCQ